MKKKGVRTAFLFLLLLFLDQSTKFFTFRHIPLMSWTHTVYPYGGIPVFQDLFGISFSLNQLQNLGAAWGLFAAYSEQLLWVRLFFVGALFFYWLFFPIPSFKRRSLFLILVGALGNVIDFFVYGHVIDMFHFNLWGYDFPVFNVADSLICIGVLFLFLLSFHNKKEKKVAL